MTKIKFQSLSSGSCGNCYFIGIYESETDDCLHSVIIDAGVSPRRLKREFQKRGIPLQSLSAMLLTHDHMDHIRSLGSYCKYGLVPVWMTKTLHASLSRHFMTGKYLKNAARLLDEGWNELIPGFVRARYFVVPHDATQTVGYALDIAGHKFVIMTDIGRMTPEALELASGAGTVVIESNYDLDMLRNGSYPKALQDRICGGHGHLSNAECAEAIRNFAHDGLRSIFLCHLSEHNNTPALALETSREAAGATVRLVALPRETPSEMFEL